MLKSELKQNLAYIASNFASPAKSIKKLEKAQQSLHSPIGILKDVKSKIDGTAGPIGERIRGKFERILRRNPGLDTLVNIGNILRRGDPNTDVPGFTVAHIVSVDVEGSFSRYKSLLSDRRHRLAPENTMMHVVSMCNPQLSENDWKSCSGSISKTIEYRGLLRRS